VIYSNSSYAAAQPRQQQHDVLQLTGMSCTNRSATQKWELVAECARHLRLGLRRVPLELRQPPRLSPAGGPDTADAPGTEALLDMLGRVCWLFRVYKTSCRSTSCS
jgi:hypothetical protein